MEKSMSSQIININDVDYSTWEHGDRFKAKLGAVSSRIGASKLGYNITVLAKFSAEGDGKPTVMRYIIRDQAEMAEYWEGE